MIGVIGLMLLLLGLLYVSSGRSIFSSGVVTATIRLLKIGLSDGLLFCSDEETRITL